MRSSVFIPLVEPDIELDIQNELRNITIQVEIANAALDLIENVVDRLVLKLNQLPQDNVITIKSKY